MLLASSVIASVPVPPALRPQSSHSPWAGIACDEMVRMDLCANRTSCFPHWNGHTLVCRDAAPVDCAMRPAADGKKLLMFASLGLINNALKRGFRELVLRLPEEAWMTGGAAIKEEAHADSSGEELAWRGMREPSLYKGLTALVLWDPCFLKESFWNAAHPDFGRYANYVKLTETETGAGRSALPRTSPRTARGTERGESWAGLEEGYCEDWTSWLADELGFETDKVHRLSLFDRLASAELTQMVFEIQKSSDERPDAARLVAVHEEIARTKRRIEEELADPNSGASGLMALIARADVIALNGGNPDFLKFVLMELAAPFTRAWTERVRAGRMVFLGRSAGAMVGGRDISLTSEPNPLLLDYLLPSEAVVHAGLGLAGECSFRPHYSEQWDLVVALARQQERTLRPGGGDAGAAAKVVRLPNEEALQCIGTRCKIVGDTSREAAEPLSKRQLRRLVRAFDQHAPPPQSCRDGGVQEETSTG